MTKFRLLYFNLRGRAEPVRWIFAAAEQAYEDERIDMKKEWPNRKKGTPYGKLPVLYIDDTHLCQSVAICRHLGRLFDLSPDEGDPFAVALGDEVVDTVHDLIPPVAKVLYAKKAGNMEEAERLKGELATILQATLKQLEARLKGKEWYCGDKMTWIDIFAACYLSVIVLESAFEDCPAVKAHVERVVELPQIKAWIEKRPVTEH